MKKTQRQDLIIQRVRDSAPQELLSTREFAQEFSVSEATIRPDFQELADAGLLQRQYGGAHPKIGPTQIRQGQIGILMASRIDKYRDPFYNMVLEGADKALERLGYQIAFVKTLHDVGSMAQAKILLDSFPVKGLIVLGTADEESITYLRQHFSPIVTMTDKHDIEDDLVLFDGARGMQLMVEHLANLGYRRLGFIAGYADIRYFRLLPRAGSVQSGKRPDIASNPATRTLRLDTGSRRARRASPDEAEAATGRDRLRLRPFGDRRHGLVAAERISSAG